MPKQTLPFPNYEFVAAAKLSPAEKVLRERAAQKVRERFPHLGDFSINKIVNQFVSE